MSYYSGLVAALPGAHHPAVVPGGDEHGAVLADRRKSLTIEGNPLL